MLRVIKELRPAWVVGENVAGIVNMALDTVLSDLESQGYETRAFVFPACAVDAPHRRDRCAIIAHAHGRGRGETRERGGLEEIYGGWQDNLLPPQKRGGNVSDADSAGLERTQPEQGTMGGGFANGGRRPAQPGLGRSHDGLSDWLDGVRAGWANGTWEEGISRLASGVPDRAGRLKCLGNAVVPQQFYPVFRAIAEAEEVLAAEFYFGG